MVVDIKSVSKTGDKVNRKASSVPDRWGDTGQSAFQEHRVAPIDSHGAGDGHCHWQARDVSSDA